MNSRRKVQNISWLEPFRVRNHFYPFQPAKKKRIAVVAAFATFFAVWSGVFVVQDSIGSLFRNIAGGGLFGTFFGVSFAVVVPMVDRFGGHCAFTSAGVERLHSMASMMFPMIGFVTDLDTRTFLWPWSEIRDIVLVEVPLDGSVERVIFFSNADGEFFGCIGVARSISDEQLDACLVANGMVLTKSQDTSEVIPTLN